VRDERGISKLNTNDLISKRMLGIGIDYSKSRRRIFTALTKYAGC
jgi:hypothetical protein